MKTVDELSEFLEFAAEGLGDPSFAICQLFLRYVPLDILHLPVQEGELLVAYLPPVLGELNEDNRCDRLILRLAEDVIISVRVSVKGPEGSPESVRVLGLREIVPGMWTIWPSLNLPKVIHAFVVLYDVPRPAPWDSNILIME